MTDDSRRIYPVLNKMMSVFEENGGQQLAPVILVTPLLVDTRALDIVRKIVCATDSKAKHALETATDFHVSVFAADPEGREHAQLMALH
jgi:hypothetical protein